MALEVTGVATDLPYKLIIYVRRHTAMKIRIRISAPFPLMRIRSDSHHELKTKSFYLTKTLVSCFLCEACSFKLKLFRLHHSVFLLFSTDPRKSLFSSVFSTQPDASWYSSTSLSSFTSQKISPKPGGNVMMTLPSMLMKDLALDTKQQDCGLQERST